MRVREFPVAALRRQFPALRCAGSGVFFDNAAGAQVPDGVIEALRRHLIERNVQRGGRYGRSVAVDAMAAAIDYLAELGRTMTGRGDPPRESSIREDCRAAMAAIREHEQGLSRELLRVLRDYGAQIHGLWEEDEVRERVPTVCFNLPGIAPAAVTEAAAAANIGIRDGHMYSPRRRLGVAVESGAVRASLVHYNTLEEIQQLGAVLSRLREPVTSVLMR